MARQIPLLTVLAQHYPAARRRVFATLLAALVFVVLHSAFHNPFHHGHDAGCSVYVLEQLYFGTDVPAPVTLTDLFIPFAFDFPPLPHFCHRAVEHFQIRAPPAA